MIVNDSAPLPAFVSLASLPSGADFANPSDGKHYTKLNTSNLCFCYEDETEIPLAAGTSVIRRNAVSVTFGDYAP